MHHVRTARARRHSRCVGMMRLHGACRCRARAFCRATSPRTRPRRKCASCWAACQSTCVLRAPSVGVPQLSALASQSTHVSRARRLAAWPAGRGVAHSEHSELHSHDEQCSAPRVHARKGGGRTEKNEVARFPTCFKGIGAATAATGAGCPPPRQLGRLHWLGVCLCARDAPRLRGV